VSTIAELNASLAGRYILEREIGAGGMATVYVARDERHDRRVAVKVLNAELAGTSATERLLREIHISARLTHPNIISLHDSGTVGQQLYYVMPWVEGESLRDLLDRDRQLPIDVALRLATEVADALAHAHAQGIVHRDIKPENILLAGGHALVADFGIAQALEVGGERLTATGVAIGTPTYMSPEQASGERVVDGRSDVYALGCVLYEMLAGQPPFSGATAQAIVARHLADPVPPLRTVRSTVPKGVNEIVERSLAKAPADRYPNAIALLTALNTARAESGGTAARVAPQPAAALTGRPALRLAAGALAIAVLAVIWSAGRQRRDAAAKPASGTSAAAPLTALDRERVAVLPLEVAGEDPAIQYLADGMTDQLISELSRIPALSVIASSSVARFKGAHAPVREIGRALSAGSAVTGSVRRWRDSLRVSVQLVDANQDAIVWSREFAGGARSALNVGAAIAQGVASALSTELAASGAPGTGAPPAREAAFDAYLRGNYLLSHPVPGGNQDRAAEDSAIAQYERAIALDPKFALSYAALASVYQGRFFNRDADRKWEEKAFVAIEKAMALDPELAETYQEKAKLIWTLSNGFPHEIAARLHKKALALKPSFAAPHFSLGALYMHTGLLDRALAEYDTALRLDPEQHDAPPRIARIHWFQGRYALAEREFARLPGWERERAVVLAYLGRRDEALALLNSATADTTRAARADRAASRAVVLASLGRHAEANREISQARSLGEGISHFHHSAYMIAQAYALRGDRVQALTWLQRTADDGMPCYPLFRDDPNLTLIRGDPGFVRFLEAQRRQWEGFKLSL
jgi:serine/threonine-protein kinase